MRTWHTLHNYSTANKPEFETRNVHSGDAHCASLFASSRYCNYDRISQVNERERERGGGGGEGVESENQIIIHCMLLNKTERN